MGQHRRSHRRDFLRGQSAARALVDAADQIRLAPAGDPADVAAAALHDAETYLVQFARRAMACQFEIMLNAGEHEHGGAVALEALDLVDRLEDQLSSYRPHSEISQLNRAAFAGCVPVEARLFGLLEMALRLHAETGGAYDVTAGSLSRAWGFTFRAGAIPSEEQLAAARACVGSQWVELAPEVPGVRFLRAGMEINLGSIGKGYALDCCAEHLDAAGISSYLLHGGHSSVLARGTRGASAAGGWQIGLRNPLRPERRLGTLRVQDAAVGTSGSGTQFFDFQGRRYGHILDPRTGWPAQGVLSATVIAASGAEADALSTAMYVLGPMAAADYCQRRPEIGCVLACPGKASGQLELHILGRASELWRGEAD